jgi:glycosyltransferase involved in cell wall biosynthesis
LEALAAGLPLVVTNVCGAADLLTDGVNALLVGARDVPGLGAALRRVAQEPALRETLRVNGQHVAERYSWDYTAEQFDKVYTTVLNSRLEYTLQRAAVFPQPQAKT